METSHASDRVRDVWPPGQDHLRPIVTTLYLLSIAVLSALLSRRWIGWSHMKRLPIAKLLVVGVLGDSLLFVFASAVLVLGVGTSYNDLACKLGIWWCILLYASSKVLIYAFLSEKLYAVYSITPTRRIPRWQSTQYKIAMAFLVLWIGVAVVMIIGRIADIRRHDSACVIGLRLYSTVPMLAVDALVNIYLTAAFVIPVWRSKWNKAQRLALNSSIAAMVALITSFANIVILTVQHGHQLSWVCLGSCGLDVCINAVILYIVTASSIKTVTSSADPAGCHTCRSSHHHPLPATSRLARPETAHRTFSSNSLEKAPSSPTSGMMVSTLTRVGGGEIHVMEEVVRVEDCSEESVEKEEEWLRGRRSRVGSGYKFPEELVRLPKVEFEEMGNKEKEGDGEKV